MKLSILLFSALFGFYQSAQVDPATEPSTSMKYPNPFKGKEYRSGGVPFETADRESYTFTPLEKPEGMMWGNFINFDHHTFSTHYSAPCGNDCFTSVSGEYRIVGDGLMEVKVMGISRSGFCREESVEGFQFQAYYKYSIDDEGTANFSKHTTADKAAINQK